MGRAQMDKRAKEQFGQKGWYCCKYVGYIVYGTDQNRKGAKGWLTYGSATNNVAQAVVVVVNNGQHVGYITDGGSTVYDAPGVKSGKEIRKTNFNTWISWFDSYKLRK